MSYGGRDDSINPEPLTSTAAPPINWEKMLRGAQERVRATNRVESEDYTRGILLGGDLPSHWTDASNPLYIDLTATGDSAILYHDAMQLRADGTAYFTGDVSAGSVAIGGSLDVTGHSTLNTFDYTLGQYITSDSNTLVLTDGMLIGAAVGTYETEDAQERAILLGSYTAQIGGSPTYTDYTDAEWDSSDSNVPNSTLNLSGTTDSDTVAAASRLKKQIISASSPTEAYDGYYNVRFQVEQTCTVEAGEGIIQLYTTVTVEYSTDGSSWTTDPVNSVTMTTYTENGTDRQTYTVPVYVGTGNANVYFRLKHYTYLRSTDSATTASTKVYVYDKDSGGSWDGLGGGEPDSYSIDWTQETGGGTNTQSRRGLRLFAMTDRPHIKFEGLAAIPATGKGSDGDFCYVAGDGFYVSIDGADYAKVMASGVGAINDLSDVSITSADSGDYLRYDGSNWVDVASSQIITDIQSSLSIAASQITAGTFGSGDYVFPSTVQAVRRVDSGGGYYSLYTNGVVAFSGGSSTGSGANMLLYGESHATKAKDIRFRAGTTDQLSYDFSASLWTFVGSLAWGGGSAIASSDDVLQDITSEPLSSLSDVTITSIASGELLKWNGSAWINNTLAEAGISATGHTHAAGDITSGTLAIARGGTNAAAFTADEFIVYVSVDGKLEASGYGASDFATATHTHVKTDITDTPWAWTDVSKTGSSITDLASHAHSDLSGIGADDHHAQSHALAGSDHTGQLTVAKGGTGLATVSAGSLLYGAGTSNLVDLAIGTPNYILAVNTLGTAPEWIAHTAPAHNQDASTITSGTFADARIAQSNVTQYESALSIGADQITAGTFGSGTYVFNSNKLYIYNSFAPVVTLTAGDNSSMSLGNRHIDFGYSSSSTNYRHTLRTKHNGAGVANNAFRFYLHTSSDAVGSVGTFLVADLDGGGVDFPNTSVAWGGGSSIASSDDIAAIASTNTWTAAQYFKGASAATEMIGIQAPDATLASQLKDSGKLTFIAEYWDTGSSASVGTSGFSILDNVTATDGTHQLDISDGTNTWSLYDDGTMQIPGTLTIANTSAHLIVNSKATSTGDPRITFKEEGDNRAQLKYSRSANDFQLLVKGSSSLLAMLESTGGETANQGIRLRERGTGTATVYDGSDENDIATIIISSSDPSGTARDGTLWVKV